MPTLRNSLNDLTSAFASSILAAIRGASLEELVGKSDGGVRRGPGRPPKAAMNGESKPISQSKPSRATRAGRLKRRSPEDIAKALDQVVALVKKNKTGLRAEQIRQQLGLQSKEMPRVLKEGIANKQLKSKGQKRATTYSAA